MSTLPDPRTTFLLALARALHVSGYPAHRLEAVLMAVSDSLKVEAQFFSTPTSLFAAIGQEAEQRTHLLRVEPGSVHLERLDLLLDAATKVRTGVSSPTQGCDRIRQIMIQDPRWRGPVWIVACGLSSACASRFLGGGPMEILGAFLVGIGVAVLMEQLGRHPPLRGVLTPLAGFLAAVIATLMATFLAPASVPVILVGGLIALVPGFMLTVATSELSAGHLVSGTARMTGAVIQLMAMIIGVAAGLTLMGAWLGPVPPVVPMSLPPVTELVALLLAPLTLAIVLQAAPSNFGWILAISIVGFAGGRLGASALGPELGLLVGALAVGLLNGFLARRRANHGAANMVPALIMLVPGSVGFRSLTELLDQNVLSGVELAFRTALMTSALSAGIILANALTPGRRLVSGRHPGESIPPVEPV